MQNVKFLSEIVFSSGISSFYCFSSPDTIVSIFLQSINYGQ